LSSRTSDEDEGASLECLPQFLPRDAPSLPTEGNLDSLQFFQVDAENRGAGDPLRGKYTRTPENWIGTARTLEAIHFILLALVIGGLTLRRLPVENYLCDR
jgi:hypothetical protein